MQFNRADLCRRHEAGPRSYFQGALRSTGHFLLMPRRQPLRQLCLRNQIMLCVSYDTVTGPGAFDAANAFAAHTMSFTNREMH